MYKVKRSWSKRNLSLLILALNSHMHARTHTHTHTHTHSLSLSLHIFRKYSFFFPLSLFYPISIQWKSGATPLHLAAASGSSGAATVLVEFGADVNAKDLVRLTLGGRWYFKEIKSCSNGPNIIEFRLLPPLFSYIHTYIHSYVHPSIHTYSHTHIHTYSHQQVILFFPLTHQLTLCYNPWYHFIKDGATPLHLAAWANCVELCSLFSLRGADLTLLDNVVGMGATEFFPIVPWSHFSLSLSLSLSFSLSLSLCPSFLFLLLLSCCYFRFLISLFCPLICFLTFWFLSSAPHIIYSYLLGKAGRRPFDIALAKNFKQLQRILLVIRHITK